MRITYNFLNSLPVTTVDSGELESGAKYYTGRLSNRVSVLCGYFPSGNSAIVLFVNGEEALRSTTFGGTSWTTGVDRRHIKRMLTEDIRGRLAESGLTRSS